MKLKFKTQAYQTAAVQAVVRCFAGQPKHSAVAYRVDAGQLRVGQTAPAIEIDGFKNANVGIDGIQLLQNIRALQREQQLPVSDKLVQTATSPINLDIEMETGTGKTYCYIKTMFALNEQFGWRKFIVVVPSIAIREGVAKSLEMTADHFLDAYGKKARFFIYNSKQLHELESFSSSSDISVMIINVQAFAARGADNRRIYGTLRRNSQGVEEMVGLDDFQSRKPIDVISANRPILILDEPQKMEGAKTLDSLSAFKPLMVLRYSATHKTTHNKIHRLDALDAYNQKLVKKIAVRGISVRGLAGNNAYLYLQSIEVSAQAPVARLELEIKQANGPKRVLRKVRKGDNLFDLSNGLDQYKDRYVVADIDAINDTVSLTNGMVLTAGDALGDVDEPALRRIQIREAIAAHFDKERRLFEQNIKVLTLFFIDTVAKYRDYSAADEQGEYAKVFEIEYQAALSEVLGSIEASDSPYSIYLKGISARQTHSGYFSIDKKTQRQIDPETGKRSTETDDVAAYDLILKDKERLLSFTEPVRFIFSHSALREGWDNPNVFVICALKHSDNTVSRRQEVGRGLRLAVNQDGDRMDAPATVHDINVLTVIASESYKDFVTALQKDLSDGLSERPRKADKAYFTGKILKQEINGEETDILVTPDLANVIYRYLNKNDYTDDQDEITQQYHDDKAAGRLVKLPDTLQSMNNSVHALIASVFSMGALPPIDNERGLRSNPLNHSNFNKKEFQDLWRRINHKAAYSVHFDTPELIAKAVDCLNKDLRVQKLSYTIETGEQNTATTFDELKAGQGFHSVENKRVRYGVSIQSQVTYDLIGNIASHVQLTRNTIAAILCGIHSSVFNQFRDNPEGFIRDACRLIQEQKATAVIEHLCYDALLGQYSSDIFTATQSKYNFAQTGEKLKQHIYDYLITDSAVERDFAAQLDKSTEVVVYAKLPKGFAIPTPVGDYNPDWAIAFKHGMVKHIYFVAETKGSLSSMALRKIEAIKIQCAHKFFEKINTSIPVDQVRYAIVNNYEQLMDVVS
jgi:type III restriction enzyme